MRPVRLEIRGFTAFREPQVVDFDGLDLFAITGPTGSGKSSILDALTFVLYGRAERVGDGVRQLVSQGQPRAAVVLEFEVGRRAVPGRPERDRRRQDEDPRRAHRPGRPRAAGARPATAPTGSARPTRSSSASSGSTTPGSPGRSSCPRAGSRSSWPATRGPAARSWPTCSTSACSSGSRPRRVSWPGRSARR